MNKPNNQILFAINLLLIIIAFIGGMIFGGILTAYEVTKSIEAMGNLFEKVEIGNITIDLNETQIVNEAMNYFNATSEIQEAIKINENETQKS